MYVHVIMYVSITITKEKKMYIGSYVGVQVQGIRVQIFPSNSNEIYVFFSSRFLNAHALYLFAFFIFTFTGVSYYADFMCCCMSPIFLTETLLPSFSSCFFLVFFFCLFPCCNNWTILFPCCCALASNTTSYKFCHGTSVLIDCNAPHASMFFPTCKMFL